MCIMRNVSSVIVGAEIPAISVTSPAQHRDALQEDLLRSHRGTRAKRGTLFRHAFLISKSLGTTFGLGLGIIMSFYIMMMFKI